MWTQMCTHFPIAAQYVLDSTRFPALLKMVHPLIDDPTHHAMPDKIHTLLEPHLPNALVVHLHPLRTHRFHLLVKEEAHLSLLVLLKGLKVRVVDDFWCRHLRFLARNRMAWDMCRGRSQFGGTWGLGMRPIGELYGRISSR